MKIHCDAKDADAFAKLMTEVSGEKAVMWGTAIVGSNKAGASRLAPHGLLPAQRQSRALPEVRRPGRGPLLKKLGKHKAGKGCVYIKTLGDVDEDALRALMAATLKYKREKYE